MSKIVRLTESDLVRLVKKVINEQLDTDYQNKIQDLSNIASSPEGLKTATQYRMDKRKEERKKERKKREEEYKKKKNDEKQKRDAEYNLIKKNQIKEGTPISSIFTTNMGGVRITNDNEFIFETRPTGGGSRRKNTVKKEISYSVDSSEFKPIKKDYDFAKVLDGGSSFNDVRNAIKILDDKVRYSRTATKQGDTYTFKSKDGQKNVTVKPSYFITTEGVSPQRWYQIKTDDNGLINDIDFIKKFNSRLGFL